MDKIQYQTDQSGLIDERLERASNLIEKSAHIKEASSNAMTREMLEEHKPDDKHFLMHVVALGDYERFGYNKNGDAWTKDACNKYHDTFVTHGHFFREHKNRDPKYKIGDIKASCYNPEMGRVELAVWGDKELAEEEYEMSKQGNVLKFSMSCRVPYDRSSITGKIAKTPEEYDDYCKYRMGQYIEEHEKFACVFNDEPTFFDISKVKNPADITAHYLEYFQTEKAASHGGRDVMFGTEWAEYEGVCLPKDQVGVFPDSKRNDILTKLAHFEELCENVIGNKSYSNSNDEQFVKNAAQYDKVEDWTDEQIKLAQSVELDTLFGGLNENRSIMPFHTFVAYTTDRSIDEVRNDPSIKQAAKVLIPVMFRSMKSNGCCGKCHVPMQDMFNIAPSSSYKREDNIDKLINSADEKFGLSNGPVMKRVSITIVRKKGIGEYEEDAPEPKESEKEASTDAMTEGLVDAYGQYVVSSLANFKREENVNTDGYYLLTSAHNFIN
jgi:hypothetical protein